MRNSGIYKIQSIIKPDRFYIGSAVNLHHRWICHLSDLRKGKHHSGKLQNHFNKYGEADLVFIIIEPCLPEFLIIREQFYINELKPWFNVCPTAGSMLGLKRPSVALKLIGNKYGRGNKGKKTGMTPWNKGKTGVYSEETLQVMRKVNSENKGGRKNKGRHHSEKEMEKMKKPRSEEGKRNMRESAKIRIVWNKGKKGLQKMSDKSREKMRKSALNRVKKAIS
jgi:group I intron endonuclease